MVSKGNNTARDAVTMQVALKEVARYYDTSQSYYSRFWSPSALHYGLWYQDTKSLAEAVANTNQFVVDVLEISRNDLVLDAGCGVGGTSSFIAETTGGHVTGITLSDVQLIVAMQRIAESTATGAFSISKQDYNRTAFRNATFSKLFGIESVCHANDKGAFLREARRIMKPGGRLAILDAFLTSDLTAPADRVIYARVIEGWAIPNLVCLSEMSRLLLHSGFEDIVFHDLQRHVEESSRRIQRNSLLTLPWNFVKLKAGIGRPNLAAWYQRSLFKRGIAIYGAFVARRTR